MREREIDRYYIYIYIYTHTFTYIHIYIYTHIYIYIYPQALSNQAARLAVVASAFSDVTMLECMAVAGDRKLSRAAVTFGQLLLDARSLRYEENG